MSRQWRWSLLGLLVAVVIGGLMPNALLKGPVTRVGTAIDSTIGTTVTPMSVIGPSFPAACVDAACGKGAPAPSAPTLTVVAAAAMVGILALAATGRRSRRLRAVAATLPRGV